VKVKFSYRAFGPQGRWKWRTWGQHGRRIWQQRQWHDLGPREYRSTV